jgi:hypothetical protein
MPCPPMQSARPNANTGPLRSLCMHNSWRVLLGPETFHLPSASNFFLFILPPSGCCPGERSNILTDDYRLASSSGVIMEIKHLIRADFMSCTVSICKRGCNSAVHALVAYGCNLPNGSYNTWEGVPRVVEELVTSDLAEPIE